MTADPFESFWSKLRFYEKWAFPWAVTENPTRHEWPASRLIERYVAAAPGMRIADIGAGGGYWTFRLAATVGPSGHVLATEIDWLVHAKLRWIRRTRRAANVTVRRAQPDAPGIAPASVDVILMVDVFLFDEAHRSASGEYLRRCAAALRPGGRRVIANSCVHTVEWTPDFGKRLGSSQLTAGDVTALAAPDLHAQACEPIAVPDVPGQLPGYVLVLQKA